MEKKVIVLLLMVAFFSFASAEEFVFQQDKEVDLKVVCYNNGFCSGSATCNVSVTYPNNTILLDNVLMQNQNSYHNYTIQEGKNSVTGDYKVTGFCTDSGSYQEIDFYYQVTTNGATASLTDSIMVIALIGLSAILLVLSWFFSKGYWVLKMFFQFLAVGAGLLAINSAKILSSSSSALGKMGTVGLTIMTVILGLFFMIMFVLAFIEIIKVFKAKGDLRWNY